MLIRWNTFCEVSSARKFIQPLCVADVVHLVHQIMAGRKKHNGSEHSRSKVAPMFFLHDFKTNLMFTEVACHGVRVCNWTMRSWLWTQAYGARRLKQTTFGFLLEFPECGILRLRFLSSSGMYLSVVADYRATPNCERCILLLELKRKSDLSCYCWSFWYRF